MHNRVPTTTVSREGREGFALVTTLLIVLVLSVLAVGVAWIATSEKKTTFSESVHVRSLYSADAGTEAGINLIRVADTPPQIVSFADSTIHVQPQTPLDGSQTYSYKAYFQGAREKEGWGEGYVDCYYGIDAAGRAAQNGRAGVDVQAVRLFKSGY